MTPEQIVEEIYRILLHGYGGGEQRKQLLTEFVKKLVCKGLL